jgi:cytoplasmic tRNA 2-thiolation protein 2
MESYRIRNSPNNKRRKLLLPVSCGVSSVVLLSILDRQLQRQRENSRGLTPYDLHVLLVDTSSVGAHGPTIDHMASLKSTFPEHQYSAMRLEEIFDYEEDILSMISDTGLQFESFQGSGNNQEKLQALLSSFTSPTSTTDMEDILLRRLIIAFAKAEGCKSILWGDSDSRLASKVLANVAKGRGSSVSWQVCDGPSPSGISFNFPLRELSKSELLEYSALDPSNLNQFIIPAERQAPGRNTTINDLMDQYIESQGSKYPSIMANVVRTVNKLERPASQIESEGCLLCGDPTNSSTKQVEGQEEELCYACSRLKLEHDGGSAALTSS